jgi:hypothetical protein
MAHDVFISHSSRDKPVSDAVCAALENAGIRCWIAPRDVQPGRSFAGEITRGIQQSKAMVLIFSANSNNSSQVLREVQLAVDSQLHILQFRIEEVLLNDDLKYYLSTPHWLDALSRPLENHLDRLAASLKTLLGKPEAQPAISTERPAEIKEPGTRAPASHPPSKSSSRNLTTLAILATILLVGIALGVIWYRQQERRDPTPAPQTTSAPVAVPSVAPLESPFASSAPSTVPMSKLFQQSWDFSAGMLPGVRTEGVEVVDGSVWKIAGGKHLRFVTAGRSFLEATFDVPDGTASPTRLTVRHLSSSPDGKQPGYSPIRVTLNGSEIFRGSPAKIEWMEDEIDLGNYVQPGRNTLLWEYLDGAQTHYWLKSFRVSSGNP